jgi:hypothetical protein
MPTTKLTYHEVLNEYRKVLEAHPGKALQVAPDIYAVLDTNNYLYCVATGLSGELDLDSAFDFDASAFDDEVGAWDGETPEQTLSYIRATHLVDRPDSDSAAPPSNDLQGPGF